MKRPLSALTAFIMFVACVACRPEQNASPPLETAVSGATLTAWAWDAEFNVYALKRAADFYRQEYPDFVLEVMDIGQPDIVQKINTALSAGNTEDLPDIVPMEDYKIGFFLAAYPGCFKDLTNLVEYGNFADYKLKTMTHKGKLYGIPWDSGAAVMYYRKDILSAAGYSEADLQNITWNEYVEIGKAVKEKTGKFITVLRQDGLGEFRMFMQSIGVWYTKEDGVTPYFENNPALEEGIKIYVAMLSEGTAKAVLNRNEQNDSIITGEAASIFNGCWFTPTIISAKNQKGLWFMAPLPRFELSGATTASNNGGGSWYIFDKKTGTDAATEFMLDTFGKNTALYEALIIERDISATFLPVRKSPVFSLSNDYFGGQKTAQFVAEQADFIHRVNYGLHTYTLEDVLKDALQSVLEGKDIETALKDAQKQAESLLGT